MALGTLLGGPVVTAIGGRPTLLLSALLTIALGVAVAVPRNGRSVPGSVIATDAGRATDGEAVRTTEAMRRTS
jgi:hypothetical protein